MINEPQSQFFEFGDFRLDASKRLLLKRDGEQIPLTPKVFDTLLYLVEHNGKVIEKDELMSAIWADTIVEENNLSQNISILRRILGEKRGEHRFIATVPGKGFKFVAEVTQADGSKFKVQNSKFGRESRVESLKSDEQTFNEKPKGGRPKTNLRNLKFIAVGLLILFAGGGLFYWRSSQKKTAPFSPIKTIAVLPFKPLVAENRDEALEMGMADTLISRLGNNREIVVRPVSSVRKYAGLEQDAAEAGRALDVESVLDGSIQRWGDKIRVNVRLVKTADGTSLWTGTFDEKFTDIFVVQDAISKKVAAALALQLGGDEQKRLTRRSTENVEAYQLFLKGNFHQSKGTPQDLQKAVEYFQQAITLDPKFASAYVGLALSYAPLAHFNNAAARDLSLKAKAATLSALQLDDQLVEAHIAFGDILYKDEYDFAGAEREFKRAIELNPNDSGAHQAYGELLIYLGRPEKSLAELRRALEIDPVSSSANWKYSLSLFFARRYDEAIAQSKKTLELDDTFWWAHRSLAFTYQMTGDYAESIAERVKINELVGRPELAAVMRESFAKGGWQGFLRDMTAKQKELGLPPYIVMTFYVELGEKDKAFALLNRMREDRNYDLVMLKVDPRLDSLRDEPRFVDLLRRMNFE